MKKRRPTLHHRAYIAAESRYLARFGEAAKTQDERWEFHAGYMAGWRAAKRDSQQEVERLKATIERIQGVSGNALRCSLEEFNAATQEMERLRAGLLAHACFCGSNDMDPAVHREDCSYRKWATPESKP